jgi:hypothetical protein
MFVPGCKTIYHNMVLRWVYQHSRAPVTQANILTQGGHHTYPGSHSHGAPAPVELAVAFRMQHH